MLKCQKCRKFYETAPKKCECGCREFKWIPEKKEVEKKEKMFKDGLF
jgi:predicted  nucleic acid-binding Zn-ribbon protein